MPSVRRLLEVEQHDAAARPRSRSAPAAGRAVERLRQVRRASSAPGPGPRGSRAARRSPRATRRRPRSSTREPQGRQLPADEHGQSVGDRVDGERRRPRRLDRGEPSGPTSIRSSTDSGSSRRLAPAGDDVDAELGEGHASGRVTRARRRWLWPSPSMTTHEVVARVGLASAGPGRVRRAGARTPPPAARPSPRPRW